MPPPFPSLPPLPLPEGITESYLPSDDLNYHLLSAGSSPRNLFFSSSMAFPNSLNPEIPSFNTKPAWTELTASSLLAQSHACARRGGILRPYDQRGYGRTTNWDTRPFAAVDLSTFTFTRLVRDALILVSALGYTPVSCVIGHDFGAMAASMCALMRLDVFKSSVLLYSTVITMSHPFKGSPSLPFNTISKPTAAAATPSKDIHQALAELPEPRKHYQRYFSASEAAPDLSRPPETLQGFLRGYFHLQKCLLARQHPRPTQTQLPAPSSSWLSDADLAVYAAEWSRTGFQGALNWCRVATSPALTRDVDVVSGRTISVPALFVAGAKDWGMYQEPGVLEKLRDVCSEDMFKGVQVVAGTGHWVQQEQPERVVQLGLGFLGGG
ncbi:epoxide hydrolase [Diplocarpon mali]|nr:epoxide hydrolase [Diplocarpon mali]